MAILTVGAFLLLLYFGALSLFTRNRLKSSLLSEAPELYRELRLDMSAAERSPKESLLLSKFIFDTSCWDESAPPSLIPMIKRLRNIEAAYFITFFVTIASFLGVLWA